MNRRIRVDKETGRWMEWIIYMVGILTVNGWFLWIGGTAGKRMWIEKKGE